MRIGFVTPALPFPPEKDGQTVIAFHVLRELIKHHEVDLVSFARPDEQKPMELPLSRITLLPQPKRSLAAYALSSRSRTIPWGLDRFWSAAMVGELKRLDADPSVDCIVLHSPFLAMYRDVIHTKPVVLIAIDALSAWFSQMAQHAMQPIKRWHLQREARAALHVEQTIYPRCSAVLVVSEADRQAILDRSPKANVGVIPNGVDTNFFRPSDVTEAKTLVFSGTMNYPPNIEAACWFLQRVWPLLTAHDPKLRFVLLGRNPTEAVRRLARFDSRITVTGEVRDLRPYLGQATVYVAPIQSGTGMKNKILEALAMGKAIVGTLESMNGIAASPSEHYLLAQSPEAFTSAILNLLQDHALRTTLERNARMLAERYSWKTAAASYRSAIEQSQKR